MTSRSTRGRIGFALTVLASLVLAVVAHADITITNDPTSAFTPAGLEPGSPAGSFVLSGFETINVFNGSLNLALPLLRVGGRGESGTTVFQIIDRKWSAETSQTCTVGNSNGAELECGPENVEKPAGEPTALWKRWDPGYSPGALFGRIARTFGTCNVPPIDPYENLFDVLTRLTFVGADGSEIQLVDVATMGRPEEAPNLCQLTQGTFIRGKEFVSIDGSAVTFVSDSDILDDFDVNSTQDDLISDLNGDLMFPDGRTFEITDSRVTKIRDRNGNETTFDYFDDGMGNVLAERVKTITDPVGRTTNFDYDLAQDYDDCKSNGGGGNGTLHTIKYTGFEDTEHTIYICRQPLGGHLRQSGSIQNSTGTYQLMTYGNAGGLFPTFSDTGASDIYDPDVVTWIALPDTRKYEFEYDSYAEVARIQIPTGGAFEYDWGTGDHASATVTAPFVGGLAVGPTSMVSRRVVERRVCPGGETGFGNCSEVTKYFYDTDGVNFTAGNAIVDEQFTDAAGTKVAEIRHHFHLNPFSNVSGQLGPHYGEWKQGKELKTETKSSGGNVLRTVDDIWTQRDNVGLPWCTGTVPPELTAYCSIGPPNSPRRTQSTTTLNDASPAISSVQTFEYDQYNNPTNVDEKDFDGALLRRTETTYQTLANYTNPPVSALPTSAYLRQRLRRLPLKRLVCDATDCTDSNADERVEFGYDDYSDPDTPLGPADNVVQHDAAFGTGLLERGNLTHGEAWSTTSESVEVERQYDIAGNLIKFIDANDNTTTVSYADSFPLAANDCDLGPTDKTFAFPTSITRPIVGATTVGYDCFRGKPVTTTDPNSVTSTFNYEKGPNKLDRPLEMISAVGTTDAFKTKFEYCDNVSASCGSGLPPLSVRTAVTRDRNNPSVYTAVSESLFDGLGRSEESRQFAPGGFNTICTTYDGLGRESTVSNPGLNACSSNVTTTLYDALSRVKQVTHPDGSKVLTTYEGDVNKVTDEAGKKRDSTTDAVDRLTQVVEAPGVSGFGWTTTYTYDSIDNLTHVNQSGQVRTFTYDRLSRLLTANNPEQDAATIFTYDTNGNLKTKTEPRGIVTSNTYDGLNRRTFVNYSDATPDVTLTYDDAAVPFSKGRPTETSNSVSTSKISAYDALGRITSGEQVTSGTTYNFTYAHNLDGSLETQTYPDGLKVAYKYDSAGRPISAGRDIVGAIHYVQNILYAPHGAPATFGLGNGLTETATYNNRLQPCTITADSLLTLTLKYGATDGGNCDVESNDNNGNILQQLIVGSGNPTFTQKYTYDAVNRIASVGENDNFWQRTFAYDAFGNRAASGAGITMGSPTPTAVSQFEASTNRIIKLPTGLDLDPDPNTSADDPYDAAGNLIRHSIVGSMAYDANSKQRFYCAGHVTCTSANAIAEYRYDGAGNRIEKLTSSETATFVYDAFGKLAAEYSTAAPPTAGLFFRTLDHLGSTRLVTAAANPPNVVSRRDFLPFGEHIPANATFNRQGLASYNVDSAFTQHFTAKERDDESGLDYFLARYYSAGLGRFTGVDVGPLREDDPQSLNRYAYVRNNPLRLLDEAGNYWVESTTVAGRTRFEVFRESPVTARIPALRLAPFELSARRGRRDTNRGNYTPIVGSFVGFTFLRDESEARGEIQEPARYSISQGVQLDKEVFDAFSQEFSKTQQERVGGKPTSLVLTQEQVQTFTEFHTAFRFGKEIKKLEGRLAKATHPVDKARLARRISRRKRTEEYQRFGEVVSKYLQDDDERED